MVHDYSFIDDDPRAISRLANGLWERDHSLWKGPRAQVQNSLGWIDGANTSLSSLDCLLDVVASTSENISSVVLIGMGGSSLGARALIDSSNLNNRIPIYFADSTNSSQIRSLTRLVAPGKSLFIVSSKSGSTQETITLFRHFQKHVRNDIAIEAGGSRFVAITDQGSPLETIANKNSFDATILGQHDVGGRYSILTPFGIYPAAISGVKTKEILLGAVQESDHCREHFVDASTFSLVRYLSDCLKQCRDKLIIIADEPLASLASWIEQLISESLGKDGKGIIPVCGIDIENLKYLGDDCAIVRLEGALSCSAVDQNRKNYFNDLSEHITQPILYTHVVEPGDLGREIMKWELGIAMLGSLIGVNPFDQPQVEISKGLANEAIKDHKRKATRLRRIEEIEGIEIEDLEDLLKSLGRHTYMALLAYLPRDRENERLLRILSGAVTRRCEVPVSVGFGPSYLHSTGQLHKGGPESGVFVQLTTTDIGEKIEVPGETFDFSFLNEALADGDMAALHELGKKVVRINLGFDATLSIKRLIKRVEIFKN